MDLTKNKIICSQRIKELRDSIHLNTKEFSEELQIPHTAVLKCENEYKFPRITVLAKISDYFSVSLDYLLGMSDTPHKNE